MFTGASNTGKRQAPTTPIGALLNKPCQFHAMEYDAASLKNTAVALHALTQFSKTQLGMKEKQARMTDNNTTPIQKK